MWTSSFVLVAGGYSLALLTFCFWAVEQMNWRKSGWTLVWLVFWLQRHRTPTCSAKTDAGHLSDNIHIGDLHSPHSDLIASGYSCTRLRINPIPAGPRLPIRSPSPRSALFPCGFSTGKKSSLKI